MPTDSEVISRLQETVDLYERSSDHPHFLQRMILAIREAAGLVPGDGVPLIEYVAELRRKAELWDLQNAD